MLKLSSDRNNRNINTNWILKLNIDARKKTMKSGDLKTYYSYFTSFPQELYEFFDIKNNTLYLVKVVDEEYDIIITDKEPKLPVNYIAVKLVVRRKKNKDKKIPTTSFNLSNKFFNRLDKYSYVKFTLHPNSKDAYRNKLGLITLTFCTKENK